MVKTPWQHLSGADLRKLRKASLLTQIGLAHLAMVRRHAVHYWKAKAIVNPRGHAPHRFCKVLGLPDYTHS